jgi:hypothetical protein
MNAEPVNTRTNIVENGHFDEAYEYWDNAGVGDYYDLKTGRWEGQDIHYMSLYRGSGIAQKVPAPAPKLEGARYRLSFLYENHSSGEGEFILRRSGYADELKIALPAGSAVADPEARALDLRPMTALIEFDVQTGDYFEFEILSPTQATSREDVIVARIDLHLELDPLVLTHIVNDEQDFAASELSCLYLCYGATGEDRHQLSFELAPDSPWAGTGALLWSQDNPLEAVLVSPDWGVNQPVEAVWQVDCPHPGHDRTQQFNLSIYSKYHADTYPIAVSLGHHRLVVETVLEPAYQPVIEYGQSVKLGVQVKSYYLDLMMRSYEVCWLLEGEVLHRANTNGAGYAEFDFAPDTAGLHAIEARVQSPFYPSGTAVRTFSVKAHATDPLKAVRLRLPGMEAGPWGERTGLPDRGATYDLTVLLADDSPLRDLDVWLAWEGKDPDELGVTVDPPLGQSVPGGDAPLIWTLDCDDLIDGEFGLRLASAQLQQPTVVNAMSLARHSLKIGDVREANRVPVVDEGDYAWCMLQVQTLSNEPVVGVPVEWDTSLGLQRTYTGVNGWASVIDRPAEHGDYEIAARVNPRDGGQVLGHTFAIKTLATSAWSTASFTLDDAAVDRVGAGVVCRMGQEGVLHLAVESGSPLIGKEVSLGWREPNSSIVIAGMETPTVVTAAGVTWNVQASDTAASGVFDLQVIMAGMDELDLAFRLLPQDLAAEVSLVFDQAPKNWDSGVDLYPCIGAIHELTILPTDDLGGLHGLLLETTVTPDLPPGWAITPTLSEPSPMTAGGVRYRCDFTGTTEASARSCSVNFLDVEAFAQPPAFGLKLAHNKVVIGNRFEVATDPVLSEDESARLAVRYVSAFTRAPANDVPVVWDDVENSRTGPDGIAQRDYRPAAAGSHTVQASVSNRYDDTRVEHVFTVKAYGESPWRDLNVKANLGVAQTWGEQTFFPRRDDMLDLALSAPLDSPLIDQELTLGVSGGLELDSGLLFGPVDLGASRLLTVDDLPVNLRAGDQTNAAFYLQLSASRLLARSPLNAFSLGSLEPVVEMSATHPSRNEVKVGWGETLSFEVTLTSRMSGRPAKNIQVRWEGTDEAMESVTTVTNFYGVTRIGFIATIPGSGKVTATVVGGSEVLEFYYHVHEAYVIQELESNLLEGAPGQDVVVDVAVVSASTGEPVEGVQVRWFFKGLDLAPVATNALGKAQLRFKLPAWIGDFVLSASVPGEFGRDAARLVFTVLENDATWPGEFELWLNGSQIHMTYGTVDLKDGMDNVLELKARKDSNLIGTRMALEVDTWSFPSLGLVLDPPLMQERPVLAAPLRWVITTQPSAFGSFEGTFQSSLLTSLIRGFRVID